ncbi:MAG: hypothetical protein Q4B67_08685, partial [Eubacteriales bacterium]|nr:hypothetical protein [Eubacteriales bacterium]
MIFKGLKRKIAGLMALVMVFTSVPFTAMAEGTGAVDGTQYLSETGISPELISDGMFYFATEAAEFNEGDAGSYLLKVGRYGSFDTEASVRVKFVDISTKYGTDYRVRVLNDVASVMNIGKARSLIEYLSEGEQDEYNYTDAIIDGTVNSLNILTGNESLSEGEQAAMMSDLSYVTGAITGGSAAVNGGGVSTATPSDAASSNKNAENKNGEAGGE